MKFSVGELVLFTRETYRDQPKFTRDGMTIFGADDSVGPPSEKNQLGIILKSWPSKIIFHSVPYDEIEMWNSYLFYWQNGQKECLLFEQEIIHVDEI